MYLIVIAIIVIFIVAFVKDKNSGNYYSGTDYHAPPPERLAGRQGERYAADIIYDLLQEGDYLLTNVSFSYDDRPAELDNVIVNKHGVFIIEVKNYNGVLVGDEDDYEWKKYHTTAAGNTYKKLVKNPIKQVKRQIYLLASYLDYYGINVWVSGYALLLHANSPVESDSVLSTIEDIDKAIHTPGRNKLNSDTVEAIVNLLS